MRKTIRIRVGILAAGLVCQLGLLGCNPNVPKRLDQPPVVSSDQPKARVSPRSQVSVAKNLPPANPDFGIDLKDPSKIGVSEQVRIARLQSAEIGQPPAWKVDRQQFQFGSAVGADISKDRK